MRGLAGQFGGQPPLLETTHSVRDQEQVMR